MTQVIYALHGFLGQGTDWLNVQKKMKEEKPDWNFVAIDLFQTTELSPSHSFEQWTKNFYTWMKKYEDKNFPNKSIKRTVVGYSLGGRLALHLLHHQPDFWTAAAFISTNPGLQDEAEKLQRLENDRIWSEKFLKQNFYDTILEWNNQAVLRCSFEPERQEENYKISDLAAALLNWSLAAQKDFRQVMDLWNIRQIWIAGEKDQKFSALLKTLPESQDIQRWVVEGASHRLLFEAPEEVAHFIIRVSSPLPTL